MALEQRTLMDHQHRRSQIADNFGPRPDFDALARDDIAADFARDDDRGRAQLRRHHRGFADRQALLAEDFAIDLAVDSRRSVKRQLPADFEPLSRYARASADGA